MARSFLIRGMLVGIVAGLLALGFARLFGEPQIERAITYEEQHAGIVPGRADEPDVVSRAVQSGVGLTTAIVVYGIAIGGIFALAVAFAYGRIGNFGARATSAFVAGAGFLAIVLVPNIKYPANPPAVSNPDTIGERTTLYFALIVISIVVLLAAVALGRTSSKRYGNWNAALIAAAFFVAVLVLVGFLLPGKDEIPADFPAAVLWKFRVASLGTQVVLWSTLGLLFGYLTERSLAVKRRAHLRGHRPEAARV